MRATKPSWAPPRPVAGRCASAGGRRRVAAVGSPPRPMPQPARKDTPVGVARGCRRRRHTASRIATRLFAGGSGPRPSASPSRRNALDANLTQRLGFANLFRPIYGRKAVHRPVGAWLSLVERCVRDAKVGGSNPLAPTSFPSRSPAACCCGRGDGGRGLCATRTLRHEGACATGSLRHERPPRRTRAFAAGGTRPSFGKSADSPAVVRFAPDANPRVGSTRVP